MKVSEMSLLERNDHFYMLAMQMPEHRRKFDRQRMIYGRLIPLVIIAYSLFLVFR